MSKCRDGPASHHIHMRRCIYLPALPAARPPGGAAAAAQAGNVAARPRPAPRCPPTNAAADMPEVDAAAAAAAL